MQRVLGKVEKMKYTLRSYQQEAVEAAVSFLKGPERYNAIEVLPTGSGKSLIIANIVDRLEEPALIFQPSKEILEQNCDKLLSYGYRAAVYSSSKGRQEVSNITLATIGSVVNKAGLFANFRYIIVDECHKINAEEGMYKTFLDEMFKSGARVLGLTATPYRLVSDRNGSELRFLTRTTPRVFQEMIYHVQNGKLFQAGYLAQMEYATVNGFDRDRLEVNNAGADFTDESLQEYYRDLNFADKVLHVIEREIYGNDRKNILVFTRFVDEARYITDNFPGSAIVTGETHKKEREKLIAGFKAGDIPVVCNVGVLTTGFDYPELETVILARPTMSLALFYQMVGRSIRPHPKKDKARIVDMCGNYKSFGKIEELEICDGGKDGWFVASGEKRLTNVRVERCGR
jgi:DNA repair protein RadD